MKQISLAVVLASMAMGTFQSLAATDSDVVAAFAIAAAACGGVKDDKARLECFDKAISTIKDGDSPTADTASTKDMLATFAPGDFKIADTEDVHIAPRKFLNKPITVKNLQCFFADKEDYRCVSNGGLVTAFFVPKVGPDDERDRLENDCGSVKAMLLSKCRRTIRIVPTGFEKDTVNGMTERIVVKAKSVELLAAETQKRKR